MAIAAPERAIAERGFELTTDQRTAVEWADGPLMVLAGAGTGKTTVVVERVRHLLASDPSLEPENVLVLTYNVKAAAELMDRLEEALGWRSRAGCGSTISIPLGTGSCRTTGQTSG